MKHNNLPVLSQELSNKLHIGEVSAVDCLHAYQWKAIQLNQKLNCVVHFIEDAEDEARKCDNVPINGINRHFTAFCSLQF